MVLCWKLVYPVCMYSVPKEVTVFSGQLKYVDTCPNEPVYKKAYCKEHCKEVLKQGKPTDLRKVAEYKSSSKFHFKLHAHLIDI